MKNFLFCLVCLFLSSCLNVSDFADYWSRGHVEKTVLGSWDQIDPQNHLQGSWDFRDQRDGEYHFIMHDGRERRDAWQGKTLDIGNYKFMMVAMNWHRQTPGGILFRYEIKGDQFFMYGLDPKKAEELIKSQHLDKKNIVVSWQRRGCCTDRGTRIKVQKLDTAVVKFLAGIPDNSDYWQAGVIFVRHPVFKFNE